MSVSIENRGDALGVAGSPPATRHRTARWRDPRLVVGVALVGVCGLAGAALLDGTDATASLWAASRPLAAGETVTGADLVRRDVGFAEQSDADRYVSAAAPVPEGTVLSRDVGPGELLPRAALGQEAPTVVEVPIAVSADVLPATVRPGSVVDVYVTADPDLVPGDGRVQDASRVFVDVTVLAVPRSGGGLGPAPTRQVVIGVGPEAAEAIPAALAQLSRGSAVLVRKP